MPELAEVETVARGLRSLVGRRIATVRVGKDDFIDQPERLSALLPGSRLAEVRRHGKLLLLTFERELPAPERFCLVVHLGMTGQLVIHDSRDAVAPHTHVRFGLDDGRELRYTDIRRFGRMGIVSIEQLPARLQPFGADPLESSETEFRRLLANRRGRVKALLLNQAVLRGLGNIYADESLWHARLHPMRAVSELTKTEVARLWRAIRMVVREAIRLGGTSIANYVNARGRPGRYQERLRVYRRARCPCPRCRTKLQRVIVAGRSSHFCPRCQPAPVASPNSKKGLLPRRRLE
jgi:formamidopyrimidine-DNA glycosylase